MASIRKCPKCKRHLIVSGIDFAKQKIYYYCEICKKTFVRDK